MPTEIEEVTTRLDRIIALLEWLRDREVRATEPQTPIIRYWRTPQERSTALLAQTRDSESTAE